MLQLRVLAALASDVVAALEDRVVVTAADFVAVDPVLSDGTVVTCPFGSVYISESMLPVPPY
jgi:hypothetical protein